MVSDGCIDSPCSCHHIQLLSHCYATFCFTVFHTVWTPVLLNPITNRLATFHHIHPLPSPFHIVSYLFQISSFIIHSFHHALFLLPSVSIVIPEFLISPFFCFLPAYADYFQEQLSVLVKSSCCFFLAYERYPAKILTWPLIKLRL